MPRTRRYSRNSSPAYYTLGDFWRLGLSQRSGDSGVDYSSDGGKAMKQVFAASLLLCIASCTTSQDATSHNQERYKKIEATLKADLRGIPFGEFERRLAIQGAPWDEDYTNQKWHSRRVYHLGGFFLDVSLEHKDGKQFTDSHFFPGLHADGLTREQRMARRQECLNKYFSERANRAKRNAQKN